MGAGGQLHPQLGLEGTFAHVAGVGTQAQHGLCPDEQVPAGPGGTHRDRAQHPGVTLGTHPHPPGSSRVGGQAEVGDAEVVIAAVLQYDVGLAGGG